MVAASSFSSSSSVVWRIQLVVGTAAIIAIMLSSGSASAVMTCDEVETEMWPCIDYAWNATSEETPVGCYEGALVVEPSMTSQEGRQAVCFCFKDVRDRLGPGSLARADEIMSQYNALRAIRTYYVWVDPRVAIFCQTLPLSSSSFSTSSS